MGKDEFIRNEIQLGIMLDMGCPGDSARITFNCPLYFQALFRHNAKLVCGRHIHTLWTFWKN